MRIIICRHGETDQNSQQRLQGRVETSVNARGMEQAKLVAQKLEGEKFDAVSCSPQKRCRQTIEEIIKFHPENKINFRGELMEVDLGKYSGMDRHEIEMKFPGDWTERVDNKYGFVHEGGESYKQADENRVRPLLKEFREKYSSRTILVVTHGGICRLLLGNLLGLAPNEKMSIELPNDCIYYVDYLPHKTKAAYFLAESGISGEGYLTKETHDKMLFGAKKG